MSSEISPQQVTSAHTTPEESRTPNPQSDDNGCLDHQSIHFDPNEIGLSSVKEDMAIGLSREISHHPNIDNAIIGETPDNCIEIGYTLHPDRATTVKDIGEYVNLKPLETWIDTISLANYTHSKISWNAFDGKITFISHPIAPALEYALRKSNLYDKTIVSWTPTKNNLNAFQKATEWNTIEPISIRFKDVTNEAINEFEKVLKDVVTPPYPSQYLTIVNINKSSKKATSNKPLLTGEITIKYEEIHNIDDDVENDIAIFNIDATELNHSEGKMQMNGSSKSGIPNHSIDLTITSPPYLDAINYSDYESEKNNDYTGKTGDSIDGVDETATVQELTDAWLKQQKAIFKNVYKITSLGGYCAVIIGKTKAQGEIVDLPALFSQMMTQSLDWSVREKITWNKVTDGISKFGTTIQHNYPTYYHANQLTEEIYVFEKRGEEHSTSNRKKENARIKINNFTKKEVANNIWNIPPEPHNANISHPCPFPEEIPHRLISLYTYPGDTVFDPMAGSGTTTKVAQNLDRGVIGAELEPKFVNEARRRTYTEEYNRNTQKIVEYNDVSPENAKVSEYTTDNEQMEMSDFI